MPLYYLDPEREPRECPQCKGRGDDGGTGFPRQPHRCDLCNGTGRLGVKGAEPELRTWHIDMPGFRSSPVGWYAGKRPTPDFTFADIPQRVGPFPTESAALEAARAAAKEK